MLEELKQNIVDIAGMMDGKRLVNTYEGNLSIKHDDVILITPSGKNKALLTPEMIAVVDIDSGEQLEGRYRFSSEVPLHLAAYRFRPEAGAVIHSHAPYLTAYALNNKAIETDAYPEQISLFGRVPVAPYGTPGTDEIWKGMERAIQESKVILLANHGVLAVGADLLEAHSLTEAAESIATILTLANNLGNIVPLSPEQIADIKKAH